jgi:hypothetical protein
MRPFSIFECSLIATFDGGGNASRVSLTGIANFFNPTTGIDEED